MKVKDTEVMAATADWVSYTRTYTHTQLQHTKEGTANYSIWAIAFSRASTSTNTGSSTQQWKQRSNTLVIIIIQLKEWHIIVLCPTARTHIRAIDSCMICVQSSHETCIIHSCNSSVYNSPQYMPYSLPHHTVVRLGTKLAACISVPLAILWIPTSIPKSIT